MSEPNTESSIQETGIPTLTMEVSPSTEVQWPVDATLSIAEEAADAKATGDAINDLQADIADLAEEISHVSSLSYPVGAIIMTTSTEAPSFDGTWVEIAVTMSLAQMKSGKRGFEELASGQTGGDIHFWLRTA